MELLPGTTPGRTGGAGGVRDAGQVHRRHAGRGPPRLDREIGDGEGLAGRGQGWRGQAAVLKGMTCSRGWGMAAPRGCFVPSIPKSVRVGGICKFTGRHSTFGIYGDFML